MASDNSSDDDKTKRLDDEYFKEIAQSQSPEF